MNEGNKTANKEGRKAGRKEIKMKEREGRK